MTTPAELAAEEKLKNFLMLKFTNSFSQQIACVLLNEQSCFSVVTLVLASLNIRFVAANPNGDESELKNLINDHKVTFVIANKTFVKVLNRLQWECCSFRVYLCVDSESVYDEPEYPLNKLSNKRLWEMSALNAKDTIAAGGWMNSYNREYFSAMEMKEYSDNIVAKLAPFLTRETNVLEIGCGSGLSMLSIAPLVKYYFGTDLSELVIKQNAQNLREIGIKNTSLFAVPAHQVQNIPVFKENAPDVVVMNSVVHCFNGHNYFRKVFANILKLLKTRGIIFVGDVLDQDLKGKFIQSLLQFKEDNPGCRTKTDYSQELFLSKGYFYDLQSDYGEIEELQITPKKYTIENELTTYRYDVLIKINKSVRNTRTANVKLKYQYSIKLR